MNRGFFARRGRARAVCLVLALAAATSGCAQLKSTDWISRRGESGKMNKLLGRKRVEPPLDLPGDPMNGPTWSSIAAGAMAPADEPGRAATETPAPRATAEGPPLGSVPALGTRAAHADPDEPLALAEPARPAPPEPIASPPARLTPAPAAAPPAPADPLDAIAGLLEQGRQRLAQVASYRLLLTRQEKVGGRQQDEETVVLSVRRQPLAIRLEWPEGSANAGREVLYSDTECQGMLHVKLSNGIAIPPIRPDSALAMKSSRRPIQTAGLDPVITETSKYVDAIRSGDMTPGVMTYEGHQTVEGSAAPNHAILRVTPEGERWLLYLDQATLLPSKVEGRAASGELIESFRFDRIEFDPAELAEAGAFDPAKRFGSGQGVSGFLGRLTKAASETQSPD